MIEEKTSQPHVTCVTCKEKECHVLIRNGKIQKKQKTEFKWIECDMCQLWFHSTCQDLKPADVGSITKLAKK